MAVGITEARMVWATRSSPYLRARRHKCCALDSLTITRPLRPRSADRTRSPAVISQKTGIFQMSAGDYRLFRYRNAPNGSLETGR
jgi:hypothetical protein